MLKLNVVKSLHKLRRAISNILENRDGNIAVMTAFSALPLIVATGVAVDYNASSADKLDAQNILDSATLATGRQILEGKSIDAARQQFEDFFSTYTASRSLNCQTPNVDFDDAGKFITGRMQCQSNMPLLSVVGIDTMDYFVKSKVLVDINRNTDILPSDTGIEIAIIVDLSLTMEGLMPDGVTRRIDAVKNEIRHLTKLLLKDNPNANNVRISLIPMIDPGVTLSRELAKEFDANFVNRYYQVTSFCVHGRKGPKNTALSDKPKTGYGHVDGFNLEVACGAHPLAADPMITVPLTNDYSKLIDELDKFETVTSGTPGHIGLMMAGFVLSPYWDAIWPSESEAGEYNDTEKYILLMTDAGIQSFDVWFNDQLHQKPEVWANDFCDALKSRGINILALQLRSQNSGSTDKCVSSSGYYFSDFNSSGSLRGAIDNINNTIQGNNQSGNDIVKLIE